MCGNGCRARRKLCGSAGTVSSLQRRHAPISAIPEGFVSKRTMDSVASLAEAACRSGEMRLAILRFDTNACLNNMSARP